MSRFFISVFSFAAGAALTAAPDGKVHFNRDIRPIMSDTCFHCHGPDKNARKGGLRLDIREEALKPAKSGEIPIQPGKPEESEIIKRIFTTDKDDLMPPDEAHKELTPAQRDLFRQWVAEGAAYEPHWAYTPLVRPAIPASQEAPASVVNPIDVFIQEKLAEKNIKPSGEADKAALLRRVSLDLIGLPPNPKEVSAFAEDGSSGAYENAVDRLLKSDHFGERWAVWWLDVARFTDTVGFHGDQNQRIFPYRDYVIQAFNSNKRFDQFTVEQLAGDLLPNPTTEQRVATGFNRLNMVTREGGAQAKEYLAKYGAERVRTIGTAWLGSTFACAECHDHKFDPIKTRDFYAMQAFFADVKQWGVYADYGYTPNPDLKGWTNEHPFPPEIQVESPYLEQRAAEVRRQLRSVALDAFQSVEGNPQQKAAFDIWREEVLALRTQQPDEWTASAPTVSSAPATPPKGKAEKKEAKKTQRAVSAAAKTPEGKAEAKAAAVAPLAFTVQPDQSILAKGKMADDTTVTLHPAGWVSAVRLELIPDAAQGGGILRGGVQASASLKVTASWTKLGGKKAAQLPFRHADANLKKPRYNGGAEMIGIKDDWLTDDKAWNQSQTGVYVLDKPVHLAAGDTLTVKIAGNMAGRFRVSTTPLGPRSPEDREWGRTVLDALAAPSPANRAILAEAYLLSTGFDTSALSRYDALYPRLLECRDGKAWTMVTEESTPLTVRILPRGNWMDQSGDIVQPAVPGFLPASFRPNEEKRATRLDLAHWLCSKENPLTARAEMNRLWRQFFGNGISMVVDDLGAQGEPPSHPELLDWLGCEFRDSGWDFKHMVKLVVMSHTYRQSSKLRPELREIDPTNRLLASQNPRRLDAEFVRDNALSIAGLLNLDIGGPSVFPYQPPGYYANLQFPSRVYLANADDRQWRRGVYMHWQRTFLHPMLANFDAPMRDECTANRNVSNTPQQALTPLNDPTFVEASRVFATRILIEKWPGDEARLNRAYELALSRPVNGKEKPSLLALLKTQREYYTTNVSDAERLERGGNAPVCPGCQPAELAAWTTLCRVILNLHETITRY